MSGSCRCGGKHLLQSTTRLNAYRSFSTSRVVHAPSRAKSQKEKKDANLRNAFELYHLAGKFFPSRVISSTSQKREAATTSIGKDATKPATLDDEIDVHILDTVYPKMENDINRGSIDRLDQKNVHMRTAYQVLDNQNSRSSSDFDLMGSRHSEDSYEAEIRAAEYVGLPSSLSRGTRSSNLNDLPPVEDTEAVQAYIAEKIKAMAPGYEDLFNANLSEGLENRSARVRDALYGTIDSINPGLEVVRERSRNPNVQEIARRLEKGKSQEV